MIQFFITQDHPYTVLEFIDSWAAALRGRIGIAPYERLQLRAPVVAGVCIFTDLERLLPFEMAFAQKLAGGLLAFPENYLVLNEPRKYAGRFRLLQLLHERGINHFKARRLHELDDLRFPVFLRSDLDHNASLTPLLYSPGELKQAAERLTLRQRLMRNRLMVVEYCDCSDAGGLFRKYSAMNINGTLMPRHVLFSKNWMTKTADVVTASTVAEETDFITNFPHAAQLHEVFRLAGVDYGRIDYGLRDGCIQVWEINTNPMIVPRREKIHPLRQKVQVESARQIIEALEKLSTLRDGGTPLPFRSLNPVIGKAVQLFSRVCRHDRK